jgi:hypothetical protein
MNEAERDDEGEDRRRGGSCSDQVAGTTPHGEARPDESAAAVSGTATVRTPKYSA